MFRSAWWATMGVLAVSALALLVVPSMLNTRYFPTDFTASGFGVCDGYPLNPFEDLQEYGPVWRQAGERPLLQLSEEEGGRGIYRFTWVPSMSDLRVVIRLNAREDDGLELSAVRYSMGDFGPHAVTKLVRPLTQEEQARVGRLIAGAGLATLQPGGCAVATDGQRWIVETVESGRYTYTNRHSPLMDKGSPGTAPILAIGQEFVTLTGWRLGRRFPLSGDE